MGGKLCACPKGASLRNGCWGKRSDKGETETEIEFKTTTEETIKWEAPECIYFLITMSIKWSEDEKDGQCSWFGEDEKYTERLPEGKRGLPRLRRRWKDNVSYIVTKQGLGICTGLIKPILSICNPGNRLTTDFSESLPRSLISWALRVSLHVRTPHIKLLSSCLCVMPTKLQILPKPSLQSLFMTMVRPPSSYSQTFKTHRNVYYHYFIKERHLSQVLNAIYSYGFLFSSNNSVFITCQ